jgi:pimeloyl-ACP methyl ester carboxylesterase
MDPAEALGRVNTLESAHRPRPLYDTMMVLLQMIIQGAVGAMTHLQPTLVVNRCKDVMLPTINSFTLSQPLPNAQLIVCSDSGHASQFQFPDLFLLPAGTFLDG